MLGISTINIELTNRCNKDCWMCGRRKNEPVDPGDMDYRLFMEILSQLDPGMVVQCHWNGEPTLYPALTDVARAIRRQGCIAAVNTNGLNIISKFGVGNFHSIAVSIIQGDTPKNYETQYKNLVKFFNMLKPVTHKPIVTIRALGKVPPIFRSLPALWVSRTLHAPEMSHTYRRKPTMPEIGICLDLLHHPAIDKDGDVYPCVRFNPDGINWLGRVGDQSLSDILAGKERQDIIKKHLAGKRNEVPLCQDCHFYGCPTSA